MYSTPKSPPAPPAPAAVPTLVPTLVVPTKFEILTREYPTPRYAPDHGAKNVLGVEVEKGAVTTMRWLQQKGREAPVEAICGYAPLVEGIAVLAVFWLILFWMFRRKLFLRI